MAILQGIMLTKQNPCYIKLPEAIAKKYRSTNNTIRCEVDGYSLMNVQGEKKKFRILIAGGGVGGLVLALAAKKRGFDVKVFEKNLSAVRGEGRHRGPIQLQSSALAILEAIDKDVGKQIVDAGCTIGNRISGLADGLSGEWLTKFDLLTPAVDRGLPVTRVICRMTLQDILVKAIGLDTVCNESKVVDFIEKSDKVTAILDDGQKYDGDILVGADGIWSKVRSKLFGWQEAKYSDYTCYSGSADYVPPYIDTVGYRVFLGSNQYFVAVDVGGGKMQWYGFHKEPAGNSDSPRSKKKRLLELFGSWCSEVVELVSETPEHAIIRRDIYDRDMLYSWGRGRVILLGDAAHPVQPNLGQGGCMAIEDCYQLILELEEVVKGSFVGLTSESIVSALKSYERKRIIRVGIVHLVTRMASRMLSLYQPYNLDFGSGPLSFLTALRLKHPVIQSACMFSDLGMPHLLTWMTVNSGFTTFDFLTPAVKRGLPVTLNISRMTLQDILVKAVGSDIVINKSNVVDFCEDNDKVTVILGDGRKYEGDILVGADGIWSKVREKLFGWQEARYTNFTCYSGLVDYVPPYNDTIGYRLFMGLDQYFLASDVGDGKMQWYGFHKEPPGNTDPPKGKKKRLLELFGNWCSEVVTLISATPEHMILRRDVYDRDMLYTWSRERVALLGDAAHPMQPNLGQGGCMAIEDSYRLILELEEVIKSIPGSLTSKDIGAALKRYERKRKMRVGVVHVMTRMSSRMVTTFRPHLDFGSGPLSFLTALRITHPAIHSGRIFFRFGMPLLLTWMLVNHGLW